MKKVILIFIALSVMLIIVFGVGLDVRGYLNQFNDIPKFTDLIDDLNNSWSDVGFQFDVIQKSFEGVNDVVGFFSALGDCFVALWQIWKALFITLVYVPIKFIFYLLGTIWAIIPHSFISLEEGGTLLYYD